MIRRATSQDWDWISSLAASAYLDLGDYGRIIPSWLEHPGVLAFVEDGGGRCRGFALVGFYQPEDEPGSDFVADLLAIAVHPEHRQHGVGRRLLEHVIGVAGGAGNTGYVPEMRLTVADTNEVGQHLFRSSGFRVLDPNHGAYDGGQRAIRMSRPLV